MYRPTWSELPPWRPAVPWLPCRDCGQRFPCDRKTIPRRHGNRRLEDARCPACAAAAGRPDDR